MNPADIDEIHEILFRLGLATLLGAILGIDRDLHRKPAGLRVLAMVGLGACGVIIASIMLNHSTSDGLLRAVQGVLTGIGFLGAGVIMHAQGKDEVHGLTTAATIWISAIVGVVCGAGQFILAISIFAIAWFLLIGGRWIEWRIVSWSVARNPRQNDDEAKPEARVAKLQGSETSLTSDRNQDGSHT
ncbi:MAG: MgtC/SapB family protein [Pirellula sp.]|jgi:putative Mg2+ transporter-C (MgtC) family protein|nr:MgtC/SapB family protein [Pirellula sp.]